MGPYLKLSRVINLLAGILVREDIEGDPGRLVEIADGQLSFPNQAIFN